MERFEPIKSTQVIGTLLLMRSVQHILPPVTVDASCTGPIMTQSRVEHGARGALNRGSPLDLCKIRLDQCAH